MKGLLAFIVLLLLIKSVSAQTEAETDMIDTSASDRCRDEIVIVAKKLGAVTKTDVMP